MTTIYRGITVPDLTDPPNSPAQMRALVDTGGAVPRFATIAEARSAFPPGSRPAGMIVAVGTQFYASDGTDFVASMSTGLPTFANAAARTAAMPSPALGAKSVLTTVPDVIWTWTGTQWQGYDRQSSSRPLTTNSSGGFTCPWNRPFSSPPGSITVAIGSGSSTVLLVAGIIDAQNTTDDFGGVVRNVANNAAAATMAIRVYWSASLLMTTP